MCNSIGNTRKHKGYIVTLKQIAKFFSDTREDVTHYCNSTESLEKDEISKSYLGFGDFDYISFHGIDRFSRYYDLDNKSKYWLGKHQNVFLYQITGANTNSELYPYNMAEVDPNEKDYGFYAKKGDKEFCYSSLTGKGVIDDTGKDVLFPFFVLTQVSLSNEPESVKFICDKQAEIL